jgi:hypothetical protein
MIKEKKGTYSRILLRIDRVGNSLYRRGAKVKAMAICTRHSFLHIYKVCNYKLLLQGISILIPNIKQPILLLALEEYFKTPTVDTLAEIFTAVNAMDLSAMPDFSIFERQILSSSEQKEMFTEKFEEMAHIYPNAAQQQMRSPSSLGMLTTGDEDPETRATTYIDLAPGRNKLVNGRITINRDSHEFETKVVYSGIPIPIKVPVAIMPETVGDVGHSPKTNA